MIKKGKNLLKRMDKLFFKVGALFNEYILGISCKGRTDNSNYLRDANERMNSYLQRQT